MAKENNNTTEGRAACYEAAKQGKQVLIVDNTMSADALTVLIAAEHADVDIERLKSNSLDDSERAVLKQALADMLELPIKLYCPTGKSADEILMGIARTQHDILCIDSNLRKWLLKETKESEQ